MNSNPRVLVIGGNGGSWRASERMEQAAYMNGVESWVFATDGAYKCFRQVQQSDIAAHDVIIYNSNAWRNVKYCSHFRSLAESRPADTKWVTLLEGDMRDYTHPAFHVRELFDASDLVNCINRHATHFMQLLTSTKVENLGIPYPAEGIKQYRTEFAKRERRIHLCPMSLHRWLEYHIAAQFDLPITSYERTLTRRWSTILANWRNYRSILNKNKAFERAHELYSDARYSIQRESWIPDYLQQSGSAYIWLNLDERYTWGRNVLDAAGLGVPVITTRSTGHGQELFPATTLQNEFEIDEALALIKELIENEEYYHAVVDRSQEGLQNYEPSPMRKKLYELLDVE